MLDKTGKEGNDTTARKVSGKREKFVVLAENRTRNALKAIRVIAKLGNKNAYEYTEADVKKIAGALTKEVEARPACCRRAARTSWISSSKVVLA